ncbi:unnamed protein product [Caenorhabditis angaria]|uniref:Uncharacterized protein n=1 Tax=Caenorhabditis angaria TaxID=860376 RepID=A0A9P1IN66_9PELO|nr:unnamed protein product [Caenorhabditis angaria]
MDEFEFAIDYIGMIPNENYAKLDVFGRTDFLRIFDRAEEQGVIRKLSKTNVDFTNYLLVVQSDKINVIEKITHEKIVEVGIPLISSCGCLSENDLTIFSFNIAPYSENQNYRDLLVIAVPSEEHARRISVKLNETFTRFADQQLQNASRIAKSYSTSIEASSAPLDTPLTDSSHQSSVVSKAINEVLSCLRPEEVPHFREIIRKYNSATWPCEKETTLIPQICFTNRRRYTIRLGDYIRTTKTYKKEFSAAQQQTCIDFFFTFFSFFLAIYSSFFSLISSRK